MKNLHIWVLAGIIAGVLLGRDTEQRLHRCGSFQCLGHYLC